jgi:hypothetical protein
LPELRQREADLLQNFPANPVNLPTISSIGITYYIYYKEDIVINLKAFFTRLQQRLLLLEPEEDKAYCGPSEAPKVCLRFGNILVTDQEIGIMEDDLPAMPEPNPAQLVMLFEQFLDSEQIPADFSAEEIQSSHRLFLTFLEWIREIPPIKIHLDPD